MTLHQNNGNCEYCRKVINRYPGFYQKLAVWFYGFQYDNPVAHVSCAGRGRMDQEAAFLKGSSKAHWLQSAHNYNAALDIFHNEPGNLYPLDWFKTVLDPALPNWLTWLGRPDSPFHELPHVQVRGWPELVKQGILFPVER